MEKYGIHNWLKPRH